MKFIRKIRSATNHLSKLSIEAIRKNRPLVVHKTSFLIDDIVNEINEKLKNTPDEIYQLLSPEYSQYYQIAVIASEAQLKQDIFALLFNDFIRDGYFIEIGAADGKHYSNTFILEKYFGWKGVCVEPAHIWQDALKSNRTCSIDPRAVHAETGLTLEFAEVDRAFVLSTFSEYLYDDLHAESRKNHKKYHVDTVSLFDLVQFHALPSHIDYLSIDTEGSELLILENFQWDYYRFGFITVEHNHTDKRMQIEALLVSKGYVRVLESLSDFDDWYVPIEKYRNC